MFLEKLFNFAVFVAAIQYLVGEARIFERPRAYVRKHAPFGRFLTDMAACPSCAGFWLGGFCGVLGESPWQGGGWQAVALSALAGVVITPFVRGLMALGHAIVSLADDEA